MQVTSRAFGDVCERRGFIFGGVELFPPLYVPVRI